MKIAILGFAREGRSVLKFLKKDSSFANADVTVLDRNEKIKIPRGVSRKTGRGYLENLDKFDVIFRSPGIPYLSPEIQKAGKSGVKISSATKLFFEKCPGKIIGITGTKGKGTASTMIYEILKAWGKKAFLVGNIGKPALDILAEIDGKSFVVFELSSFQLQDADKSPEIAVVLDVFPDHLDAHKNLEEYYAAKVNICSHQKSGAAVFFFKNNAMSRRVAAKGKGRKIPVDEKSFALFSPENLKIKGEHNFKNAVMAASVARHLGIPEKTILKTVYSFSGNEHRLEFVRKISVPRAGDKSSVCFYNDSASTNPQTAAAAIRAFPGDKKILIAGGQDKNLDYKPLAEALEKSGTVLVVLFGQNRKKIRKAVSAVKNGGFSIKEADDLKRAVGEAYEFAKKTAMGGFSPVILFSPAATSFDMFENYADRGRKFKKTVKGLK